jgi:hypothetical protein
MEPEDYLEKAYKIAKDEIREENFRKEVDAIKGRMRCNRPFWQRIFPWKIKIERIYDHRE